MSLPGWGSDGALSSAPPRVVAAGPARALRDFSKQFGRPLVGAVLVGAQESAGAPVIARAADWRALDLKGVRGKADALVLVDAPRTRETLRELLAKAMQVSLKVLVADGGGVRALGLDDLIGPAPWRAEEAQLRALIEGRRVLITGGGGTIGGALARRVSRLGAERLILLDAAEANLFAIGQELADARLVLADVRDGPSMQRLFARERPHLVFHAAALKQVPLVETHPSQGVLTNVLGARNVAEAAHAVRADLVFVSTDKAVNPAGVMGATKRLAELYCQALDRQGGPRALTARLVNVLSSSGSVAPLFAAQLSKGGPLTVTDAAMTRYFVTIEQAAEFLLQCAARALGEEATRGAVLAPAMSQPVAVIELARDMIMLAGRMPDRDVKIATIGLRPGEKLREQLIGADEGRGADAAPGVMAAFAPARGMGEINELFERLALLARSGAEEALAETVLAAAAPQTPAPALLAAESA